MACYGGLKGILSGLTKSTDHPSNDYDFHLGAVIVIPVGIVVVLVIDIVVIIIVNVIVTVAVTVIVFGCCHLLLSCS